jgi:hypothetical protein
LSLKLLSHCNGTLCMYIYSKIGNFEV